MSSRALAETCARVAHDTNSAYNQAIGDAPSPTWDAMTEAQREGVIDGALDTLAGGGSERSHELWMASRIAEGWVWGPVKDFDKKTHPCLIPYSKLPLEQQRKDAIFQGVVRAVAAEMTRLRDLLAAEKVEESP